MTSFECLGGRCLPLSWRCNGQVECIDEGVALGTDEQDCDGELKEEPDPPVDPGRSRSQAEQTTAVTYTERNRVRDSDRHGPVDGSRVPDRNVESDLWDMMEVKNPVVTPPPIEWPCGGLLQTFYGTFSPPATRGPPLYCVWTLDPQDSRPLRLDLQQLELGHGDTLTVHNMQQGTGEVIKIVSVCVSGGGGGDGERVHV